MSVLVMLLLLEECCCVGRVVYDDNIEADEEAGVRQNRGILQGVLLLSAFRGVTIPQLPQIPGIPIIG